MQICIDTPYVTPAEFSRRCGISERTARDKVKEGVFLARPKAPGEKSVVLINMVAMAMEAAEQAEMARKAISQAANKKTKSQ